MGKMKIGERIKYWSQLLLLPIYGLSFLMPRNKKIWLFGSTFGRRFADNPRYFYLYLCQHPEEGIRPIWISHNQQVIELLNQKGFEAYHYKSLKGIWYCLRGKIYIFDNYSKDINFWTSGGAVKFNLWHGTGNKKANHDNLFDRVRHPRNLWERFTTFPRRLSDEKPHHYTLATSEPLAIISMSVFNTTRDHIIVDGYPRNDAMMSTADGLYHDFMCVMTAEEEKICKRVLEWKRQGLRIDFYMPTFRDSETDFFEVMDLQKFNEFLKENRIMFLIKLHPKSKLKKQFAGIEYSNIHNIDGENDPYTFMGYVDMLTADYSSVYSDFMLLDRPVVAFHYDYEKYHGNTRDEYVPFDEYMPERKAVTMDELMKATVEVLNDDQYKEKRKVSRDRMFLYQDAEATTRLIQKVRKII
ncbi:MAG: CDP-glycerol glycerophosphotransferase family protein [bacterium]|nr:CDP-glycerol glycerophosphotransferase family protein [bacterium]